MQCAPIGRSERQTTSGHQAPRRSDLTEGMLRPCTPASVAGGGITGRGAEAQGGCIYEMPPTDDEWAPTLNATLGEVTEEQFAKELLGSDDQPPAEGSGNAQEQLIEALEHPRIRSERVQQVWTRLCKEAGREVWTRLCKEAGREHHSKNERKTADELLNDGAENPKRWKYDQCLKTAGSYGIRLPSKPALARAGYRSDEVPQEHWFAADRNDDLKGGRSGGPQKKRGVLKAATAPATDADSIDDSGGNGGERGGGEGLGGGLAQMQAQVPMVAMVTAALPRYGEYGDQIPETASYGKKRKADHLHTQVGESSQRRKPRLTLHPRDAIGRRRG